MTQWGNYLKGVEMKRLPLFDCRAVLYPNVKCLRDYLAWRQADTHINCQYNTCYWLLVKEGMEPLKAQEALKVCLFSCLLFQRVFIRMYYMLLGRTMMLYQIYIYNIAGYADG